MKRRGIKWILVVTAFAFTACGKMEYQGSRWRNHNFKSADGKYWARVSERITGDANEATLTISIIEIAEGGARSETHVYFGEAGEPYSVVWTNDREVTIAVPDMAESSDEVGPVTVKFVRLEPNGK